MRFLLTKRQRKQIRPKARQVYIEAGGDLERCESLMKARMSSFGNILTILLITSAVLQICHTLWKFWKEMNYTVPPNYPVVGEPQL